MGKEVEVGMKSERRKITAMANVRIKRFFIQKIFIIYQIILLAVFSLFTVVNFKNEACVSTSSLSTGSTTYRNGTCFTSRYLFLIQFYTALSFLKGTVPVVVNSEWILYLKCFSMGLDLSIGFLLSLRT